MKQILYFLIGVLISVCLMMPFARADCVETTIEGTPNGHYATAAEAAAAVAAAGSALDESCNWSCSSSSTGCYKYWTYSTTSGTNNGVTYVAYRKMYYCGTTSVSKAGTWTWASYGTAQSCATVVDDDADGDGLSDKYDFYPDDPTDYKIQLLSYQEDAAGNRVRECYNTDRGDIFCIGNEHDDTLLDNISMSSDWKDSDDIVTSNVDVGDDGVIDDPQISETSVTPDVYTKSDGTPDDVGSDPEMGSGTGSDGTESVADQKIIDNTAVIAGNVSRLADHLSTQTSKLGNIDYSTAKMANSLSDLEGSQNDLKNAVTGLGNSLGTAITGLGTGIDNLNTGIEGIKGALDDKAVSDADEKAAEEQEVSEGESELENLNVDTLLGDDISGELVEGEDYHDHGELMEEPWVQELISSNPIMTVLTNSGFEYSSGSPTATLYLSQLGTHILDISDLEAGFIAFGNLLVAFITLAGLVHVVTGRGF